MTILLLLLVLFLYLKWIFIVLLLPFQMLWAVYMNTNKKIFKYCAAPYIAIERMIGGGTLRFTLYNVSTVPSLHIRKWIYIGLGVHVEPKVIFHFRTEIREPWKLRVGKGSIIGDNAILDARSGLTLGRNVNISSNVSIYTEQHDHRDPMFADPDPSKRRMDVKIKDRVWLGSNVIVLPGVTIGEGAVCCAGCVVTKDIEPYAVVAGIPARKVGERPQNLKYEFNGKSWRFY